MSGDLRMSPAATGPALGERVPVRALAGGVTTTLPATAEAPTLARRVALPAFARWPRERRDAALLMISELVTNAVLHGSASPTDRIGLDVRRRGAATRIAVTDEHRRRARVASRPLASLHDSRARSGWGLPIVAALSDRWGVEREPDRTCVWCELDDV